MMISTFIRALDDNVTFRRALGGDITFKWALDDDVTFIWALNDTRPMALKFRYAQCTPDI